MNEEPNGTKIIKTQRGEIIFLISFAMLVAGILGAYYSLVDKVGVMENEQTNQTALITKYIQRTDVDHDVLTLVKAKLNIQ